MLTYSSVDGDGHSRMLPAAGRCGYVDKMVGGEAEHLIIQASADPPVRGVEQSRKDGIGAYLEATATGKPIYEKCGFTQVGDFEVIDLRPYGMEMEFKVAKVRLV
jgi:hypothetical protein